MGHELAATVEEAPSGSHLKPGDTVSIIPYISCGHCSACLKGKSNCCRNIGVLGVHRDGGMTEYLSLPEQFVLKADGLSLDQAAMVEFLAIRSEEHTSELQSLMRISYAVFCLKKNKLKT